VINPLDLAGPQFLLFYLIAGIAVLLALRGVRLAAEGGPAPRIETSDPYLIAYLRGGKNEALRVAVVSLIDRGLLETRANDALRARDGAERIPGPPIERMVLRDFRFERPATQIFTESDAEGACDGYRDQLTRLGLLPDGAARAARRWRMSAAIAVLVGLAGAKIWVALGRGKSNVGFLVILTLIFVIVAARSAQPVRTARGDALLADLRTLFRRLKDRAGSLRPGGATADAVLLAAVFGLGTLPSSGFAYAKRLYPRAAGSSGSSCGSSSACGSSCGGGGGGGGGCGGCGGGGGGD
jgi:uncharacterized protein (TIGR04222 family)